MEVRTCEAERRCAPGTGIGHLFIHSIAQSCGPTMCLLPLLQLRPGLLPQGA